MTDESCRTSDKSIYAIGECAAYKDFIYGLVAPGYEMAAVAADAITGEGTRRFEGQT